MHCVVLWENHPACIALPIYRSSKKEPSQQTHNVWPYNDSFKILKINHTQKTGPWRGKQFKFNGELTFGEYIAIQ